jgi:uncharacterized protein
LIIFDGKYKIKDMQPIIGRKNELEILDRVYKSYKSEFLIIYGRRRVGKSFLINQRFSELFTFRISASANKTTTQLLADFQDTYNDTVSTEMALPEPPTNWSQAFRLLRKFAETDTRPRKVIFLDELPWFDTHGSDFLSALEHFWNSWAALRSDVLLIGCGSAASWMINELINNRGGLHNRITERIYLQPFTLAETEAFLRFRGAVYDRYQLLELYMTMGGIPYYLENIVVNRSVPQNIDRMFFTSGGILNVEYTNLFRSLFNRYEKHVVMVEALAKKAMGMTRTELLEASKLTDGGTVTRVLEELEQSGFIKKYRPFGKQKRDALYQLIDPFTLFYLSFVKETKAEGQGSWLMQFKSPQWHAWSGYAYEYICRYHIDAIKKALGISGIYAEISAWRSQTSAKGAQIDLIIDRNDRIINICEMKFSTKAYNITKSYAENLKNKLDTFETETKTNKTLLLTMITTYGLVENEYSTRLVKDVINMKALFEG